MSPESNTDLIQLVYVDDLTGLYNRRFLSKFLKEAQLPPENAGQVSFAILMMDIDHFKIVNDNFGHLEGDKLLKKIADSIKNAIMPNDIPVRYAGDEFVAILMHPEKNDVFKTAENIRLGISSIKNTPGGRHEETPVSISIGIAFFPENSADTNELLKKADDALYHSKNTGKNKFTSIEEINQPLPATEARIMSVFPSRKMLARDEQIQTVNSKIIQSFTGENQIVTIHGAAGTGKTRFLGEIIRLNEPKGILCLLERCSEANRLMPYYALSSLLNGYLSLNRDMLPEIARKLPQESIAEMSELFPLLGELDIDRASAALNSSSEKRRHLFQGILKLVNLVSEKKPLLILLDDVEYADHGTMEIIIAVARNTEGRSTICCAFTDGPAIGTNKPLSEFLASVPGLPGTADIFLESFDLAATKEFIKTLLPDVQAEDAFYDMILTATSGNPLFVEESIKNLVLSGKITHSEGKWITGEIGTKDLPSSIAEVIKTHLSTLDRDTEQLISKAAIIGPNFTLDLLKNVAGMNEGETIDIMDKAVAKRLLDTDQSSEGSFNFASNTLQKATYQETDEKFRRQIHLKIGEVLEKTNDPKEFPQVASKLAFHFRKGGDNTKAALYETEVRQKSEQLFQLNEINDYFKETGTHARLQDAENPLDPKAINAAGQSIRLLCTIAKNMRMYPSGSQLIVTAVSNLSSSISIVFESTESFTLSIVKDRLNINKMPQDNKAFAGAVLELVKLFQEHSIQSATFTKKTSPEELSKALEALSAIPPKGFYPAQHWDNFLDKNKITNLDIVQQSFVLTEDSSAATHTLTKDYSSALNAESTRIMVEVLRNFTGTVENMRIYPPGSQLITNSIELLNQNLQKLFEKLQGFTVSSVEKTLIINGKPASQRTFGTLINETLELLKKTNISSLTILKNISAAEITALLNAVFNAFSINFAENPDYWNETVRQNTLEHVSIGQASYTLAQADTAIEEKPPSPETGPPPEEEPAPPAMEDEQELAEKWLPMPPETLLDAETSQKILPVMEALLMNSQTTLAENIVAHFLPNLSNRNKPERLKAFGLMLDWQKNGSLSAVEFINGFIAEYLLACIKVENDPDVFAKLAELTTAAAVTVLEKSNFNMVRRMLWTLVKQRESDKNFAAALLPKANESVAKLASSAAVNLLFDELKTKDPIRFATVLEIFPLLGPAMAPRLFDPLVQTQDTVQRKKIAAVLKKTDPAVGETLKKEMNPFAPPEKMINLIQILDLLVEKPEPVIILNAVNHADSGVKKEAANLIKRLDKDTVNAVLNSALQTTNEASMATIVSTLGETRSMDFLEFISNLLDTTDNAALKKECIVAAGKIGNPASVPVLKKYIIKSGFLGIGSLPDEVRAAAAWALGNIKTKESEEILKQAVNDKSPAVRSAAKLGLSK